MSTMKRALSVQGLRGNTGNFLLFQLLWPAAVFGAVAGTSVWALLVLILQFLHGARSVSFQVDLRAALFGVGVGVVFEVMLITSGLITYQLQPLSWMPPLWIMLLWAGFAQTFNHSMAWLHGRVTLSAVAGGLASVVSMYAGLRFSAASTTELVYLLCVYGLSWSLIVPLLVRLCFQPARSSVPCNDGRYV